MSIGDIPHGLEVCSASATRGLPNIGGRERLELWLVREVRTEPTLGVRDGRALPLRVVLNLIAPDSPDREVACLRVPEVETTHARRRSRRTGLRQPDASTFGI